MSGDRDLIMVVPPHVAIRIPPVVTTEDGPAEVVANVNVPDDGQAYIIDVAKALELGVDLRGARQTIELMPGVITDASCPACGGSGFVGPQFGCIGPGQTWGRPAPPCSSCKGTGTTRGRSQ